MAGPQSPVIIGLQKASPCPRLQMGLQRTTNPAVSLWLAMFAFKVSTKHTQITGQEQRRPTLSIKGYSDRCFCVLLRQERPALFTIPHPKVPSLETWGCSSSNMYGGATGSLQLLLMLEPVATYNVAVVACGLLRQTRHVRRLCFLLFHPPPKLVAAKLGCGSKVGIYVGTLLNGNND